MNSHAARPWPVLAALGTIRLYQLTFSAVIGRTCRHLPTCSDYAAEAIGRHGLWPGAWIGLARICRCHPWGTHGYDPIPAALPADAHPLLPWRYGVWDGPLVCEDIEGSNPGSGSGPTKSA
jgi:putative membrane protein insertion efficiency factor